MLNATVTNSAIPLWSLAIQIATGLLIPMIVALVPVLRASRISVQQALNNDVGHRAFGTRAFDRWLANIQSIPRPLMLSIRTTFQRRGRLWLTVGSLALGGAVFVAALNVSASWSRVIAKEYEGHRYDIDIRLNKRTPIADLRKTLATVPQVAHAEYWPDAGADLVSDVPARIGIVGVDDGSTLLDLPLIDGRWLKPRGENGVVVNQILIARQSSLHVGSNVVLRIKEREVSWPIVGIVKEVGSAVVYAPSRFVYEVVGQSPEVTHGVRVVLRDHKNQLAAQRAIERALLNGNYEVLGVSRLSERRKAFEDHLLIIKGALLIAAFLVI